MKLKYLLSVGFILFAFLSISLAQTKEKISNLIQNEHAIITLNRVDESVQFIRFPVDKRMELPGATLLEKAFTFLTLYGDILGVKEAIDELLLVKTETDFIGHRHLFFEQRFENIPVFGGDIRFHFDENDKLSAINGVFIPDIHVNVTPSMPLVDIEAVGIQHIKRQFPKVINTNFLIDTATLYIFQKGEVQGIEGKAYLVDIFTI